MDEFTFTAHVSSYTSKGLDSWQTINVASKKEFPNSTHFHGQYIARVSGDNLHDIPKGRDVVFTCQLKGKYINCINWYCASVEDDKQIKTFLYQKLNAQIREQGRKSLISQRNIDALVDKHGANTIELFSTNDTNKLMPYFDNNAYNVIEACNIISKLNTKDNFFRFMAENGVNRNKATKIWEQFGNDSEKIIRQNPFLCMEVEGIGFKTCDNIAHSLNVALDSKERILAATKYVVENITARTGDISVPVKEAGTYALKQLNDDKENVSVKVWKDTIVKDSKIETSQFVYHNNEILLRKDSENERSTSSRICSMLQYNKKINKGIAIDYAERINNSKQMKLSQGQMNAVKKGLSSPVCVITGGPGTGKTTIIKTIVEAYRKSSNMPIVCMAPTGKASSRMSEATGETAHTIHKTLNIIPGVDNRAIQLPEGLIIVDEISMIDQDVMAKMMKSTQTNSQVIFVGDINQLPSVGKGDVLNQLISSGIVPVARLTETFRQKKGSLIIDNAYKVNSGDTNLVYGDDFKFIDAKDSDIDLFKKLYVEKLKQYGLENIMVLCPLRRENPDRPLNFVSDKLNVLIQNIVNPARDGLPESRIKSVDGKIITFRKGDRIMQWKNKQDASNGDIGVIKNITKSDGEILFTIEWEIDKNISVYNVIDMETITLAYAMSIHKSQGSEAQCVMMPFMDEHVCKLFQRNLLYTGITRAKKECIIIGSKKALDTCIKTEVTGKRKSYLSERLQLKMQSIKDKAQVQG